MIWICLSKRCIPANLLNCHRKVKNMMWKLRIWQKPSGRRSFTRIVVNSSRASHVDVSFTRKHPPKNVVVHPSQALSMSRSASTADIRWLETEMVHIPQSELSSDFRRLVLSGKSLYSRIPAFVFRGMGGPKSSIDRAMPHCHHSARCLSKCLDSPQLGHSSAERTSNLHGTHEIQ